MKPEPQFCCACRHRRWCGTATVAGWHMRICSRCWKRLLLALEYKLFDTLYEFPEQKEKTNPESLPTAG